MAVRRSVRPCTQWAPRRRRASGKQSCIGSVLNRTQVAGRGVRFFVKCSAHEFRREADRQALPPSACSAVGSDRRVGEVRLPRVIRRENIDLQSRKIREIAEALIAAGFLCLDNQARALGLSRSTTWTIVHAKHKNSGISASVIKQMLAQPQLPRMVRRKVLEYVAEKCSGAYGHNAQQVRRFASALVNLDLGNAVVDRRSSERAPMLLTHGAMPADHPSASPLIGK